MLSSELICLGGDCPGLKPAPRMSYDPSALRQGARVEMEHTRDPSCARLIAKHHIAEDPLYYDKLKRVHLDGDVCPITGMPRQYLRRPLRPWEHGRMLQATASLGELPELMDFGLVAPQITMEVGGVEAAVAVGAIASAAAGGAVSWAIAAWAGRRWGVGKTAAIGAGIGVLGAVIGLSLGFRAFTATRSI